MIWLALAQATVPLPDYSDVLVQREWERVNRLIEAACDYPGQRCEDAPLTEAIDRASLFQERFGRDARLEYLRGLALLYRHDRAQAERALKNAVELDPSRADAWHDLGELYLRSERYKEASHAFAQVTRLIDHGPKSWLGPWREAEAAAHLSKPESFEHHLRLALKRGFSFQIIQGNPAWRKFYHDPTIGPSVKKLITVYGTPEISRSLEQ